MGNTSISLIVLVGLLVIGGLVNYERNAALDAPLADRPYADLNRDTLDQLVETHEAQLAELTAWVEESPDASVPRQELAPSDLGGKWRAFERYQKESKRWKALRNAVLEHEVVLQGLKKEQGIRNQGLDQPWWRIYRRVTTF
jgi:hypothetical protein